MYTGGDRSYRWSVQCLGAPLIHDFALISLSDLLTPWEKIEKRLLAAAAADFVICLYNPSSKKRHDYLQKACDLILQYQPETSGRARRSARLAETANRSRFILWENCVICKSGYVYHRIYRQLPDQGNQWQQW